MVPSQTDTASGFLAVCIRCGQQDSAVSRCGGCGGAVILTRESQAVRHSSPDLGRVHLPGLDEPPRRIARGTVPPVATVKAPRLAELPVPEPRRGHGPVFITVSATLVSAGLLGLVAALLGAGF